MELKFIRQLVRKAGTFLKPGGFLIIEIGAGQAAEVTGWLESDWSEIEVLPDYSGFPRVVSARRLSG